MNTITLHMENRADNTAVSNYFIDTLMPQANGEFVKIYLYLLRCVSASHISLSVSEMADLFNQTEADILRGLRRMSASVWLNKFQPGRHADRHLLYGFIRFVRFQGG